MQKRRGLTAREIYRAVYQGLCNSDHNYYTKGCKDCERILAAVKRIHKRIEKEKH